MLARVVVFGLVVVATSAFAADDPGARCCAAKLRASGAREKQLFRCWAQAAARGAATVDSGCVAAAGAALARQFVRAEDDGACPGVGDATRIRADLERVAGAVGTLLRPTTPASACAARKLKAAGRLAQSLGRAFAEEAPRPADHLGELDPVVTALGQQLANRYAQLESRAACLTTGDAGVVLQRLASGVGAPAVPDGMLLASLRLCPACGDGVQGGGEQCDGADAPACSGPCRPGCVCPTCGDGAKDQASEACDGGDAAACPGLCQPDCTCPTPVCGNGIKEAGEDCDGATLGACVSCQPDCTCAPPVCGNGIIETGEQCDGAFCPPPAETECRPPGPGGCTCCGYPCYQFGCCDPEETCMPAPTTGYCWKFACAINPDCGPGYTCVDLGSYLFGKTCVGELGSVCFFPTFTPPGGIYLPCVGSVCGDGGRCCLPAGAACDGSGCCNGLTCTGGTCT
jgi:hypothetical protein